MLSPRLTNCVDCPKISSLIEEIDHKLTEMANAEYNNIVFALNQCFAGPIMGDLLNYRRILIFKYCYPDYAGHFSLEMISSKVKLLIHK